MHTARTSPRKFRNTPHDQSNERVRAHFVECVVHRNVRHRAPIFAGRNARVAVRRDARLVGLDGSTKRHLLLAAAAARTQDMRDQVVAFATTEGVSLLSSKIQRELFNALRITRCAPSLVEHLSTLIASPSFLALDPCVQSLVLQYGVRLNEHPEALAVIKRAIRTPALHGLSVADQIDLLRYLAGPKTFERADASRRAYLKSKWQSRRQAFVDFVEHESFTFADDIEQVEILRDFLHTPEMPVYFLEAASFIQHHAVVFGDPADPEVLSIGQRWIRESEDSVRMVLESPDREVASGWKVQAPQPLYSYEVFVITRSEELALLEWLESEYSPNAALGGVPGSVKNNAIVDGGRRALRVVAASRGPVNGDAGELLEGQPWTEAEPNDLDERCDALLMALLAA